MVGHVNGPVGVGAAVTGQRRPLTVMFCDLVGSTALSHRLDPEDYADVVLTYQEAGRQVVERFGGVVAQFAGDGLVIEFGFPVAHENDAERSVEAAFELQRVVGALEVPVPGFAPGELRCRIGIHAAVTVVGRLGADGRGDMTLFGTTANVAARVQAEAAPGEIYVTDAVIDLLRGDYRLADRRVAELRGLDLPVGIGRVVERSGERVSGISVGLATRAGVERRLAERWTAAAAGDGGAVVIVGPPGIGKSTLVESLGPAVEHAMRLDIRARELTSLTPFAALAELARRSRTDPALTDAATSLAGALADLGGSAEQAWRVVIEQARGLGMAMAGAPASTDSTRPSPRLIVVEDVHWLDASSRVAIEAIISELASSHTLLVATSRPPALLAGAEPLAVDALDEHDARRIIASTQASSIGAAVGPAVDDAPVSNHDAQRVGASTADRSTPTTGDAGRDERGAGLAPDVVDEIVARAGGVPLYVVALTQAAIAGRGAELPHSLQSSLLARLDGAPEVRWPAQVASVLGDRVDAELLAALLGGDAPEARAAVAGMVAAGLVAEAGDGTVAFSHALLREAVYSSLLQRDRRRLHGAAAAAIAERGGRDDERVTIIAHHLERADDPVGAADHLAVAARRSARRGAWDESASLAARGLGLLEGNDERPELTLHLTMTLGNVRFATEGYGAAGLHELWCRAEELAEVCGDRTEQSSAMNGQAAAALFAGRYELSAERSERILRFGHEHQDRPALVRGHCSLALAQLYAGEIARALANARAMIAAYQPGDDELLTYGFGTDHGVIGHTTAGVAAWFAGAPDADDLIAAAIAHGERIESPISLCLALQQATVVDLLADRFEAVIDRADRLIAVAERFALTFFADLGRLVRATAEACRDGDPAALDRANEALTGLVAGTSELAVTLGVLQLARCQESVGQLREAAATAAFGLDVAHDKNELIFEIELATIAVRCRGNAQDRGALDAAVARADARGAHRSAAAARDLLAHALQPGN